MNLKDGICHACFLRDSKGKTPYLMSAENNMDPGEFLAHLPQLTQVEEMIIARSHVQMMLHRYRGHQYHFTGHCVSFMQNTVKTVDMLPNLPSDLDIIVVRPSDRMLETDIRYQRQFRLDFRVRKSHIVLWLQYLKAHHPDYRYVNISQARINALLADADISSSFPAIIYENSVDDEVQAQITTDELPPTTQSMVPNLDITATEVDLILEELSGRDPIPAGLPAPSIRITPIDEASGKERIFAMAFPTLYPTGKADFNAPRIRKVNLNDYAQHLIRYSDGRFGRHPRWRFLVFNILMRRKASAAARFYVSKSSGLKDLSREDLSAALLSDQSLLPQIVRQGSSLTGTRPFWRNKSCSLQAMDRFVSPGNSPAFLTFSAADMQWQDLHRHFLGYSDVATADDRALRTFIWDGVQNSPYIVAHYLAIRLQAFKAHVLRPFLEYTDDWTRIEWQARGTGHEHGLYWIPTAPPLGQYTDESRTEFA